MSVPKRTISAGLSPMVKQFAAMDTCDEKSDKKLPVESSYVVVPKLGVRLPVSLPPPPPSPSLSTGSTTTITKLLSDSGAGIVKSSDGKSICSGSAAIAAPLTRSAEETAELIALYRSSVSGSTGIRLKHAQGSVTPALVTDTPTYSTPIAFQNIAQGDQWFNRIGNTVVNHHLTIRYALFWDQVATGPLTAAAQVTMVPPPVRMILLWDKMPALGPGPYAVDTVGDPSFSAVTNTNTNGAATIQMNLQAVWNVNTHGFRYEIIRDELIHAPSMAEIPFSTGQTGMAMGAHHNGVWHVDLKHKPSMWVTGTPASLPQTNRLYLYVIAQNPVATNPQTPYFQISFDLAYEDTGSV